MISLAVLTARAQIKNVGRMKDIQITEQEALALEEVAKHLLPERTYPLPDFFTTTTIGMARFMQAVNISPCCCMYFCLEPDRTLR